jgi:hypothetical protein
LRCNLSIKPIPVAPKTRSYGTVPGDLAFKGGKGKGKKDFK